MKIIPVLDIKGGIVVHAVRGKREEYKPIESVLCHSAEPLVVAGTFAEWGFSELYIADLDAIEKRGENIKEIKKIAGGGMQLMVDAGISCSADAEKLLSLGIKNIIVATESIDSWGDVEGIIDAIGAQNCIMSIDMMRGNMLARCEEVMEIGVSGIVSFLKQKGVRRIIVLDLSRVGSREGVFWELVPSFSGMEIIVGGGVRDREDIIALKCKGVNGVLVATALHDGSLKKEDLSLL